jgi:hypothetical protein
MGEVLFCPMDGLHDELAAAGRKTGVDIVYAMAVEVINNRIQFSQIWNVLIHFFIRFVIEITHYPITGTFV